jgi:hypothetical protein
VPKELLSKLLAAGLSAGVFLIWWPEHHPTSGLLWLIVRGGLWTLSFELLLLAFGPLERHARRALQARLSAARLRRRAPDLPVKARFGGACVLACVGAALPLSLIAGSNPPALHRKPTVTKRVVVVKRPVVRERVVVRQVVTVPAATAHPDPVVVVRRAPAKQATTTKAKKPAAKKPAHAPKQQTTSTATTPAAPAESTPAAETTPAPAPERR